MLLAGRKEDEPGHEAALDALASAPDGHADVHSLSECYSTLTGGRLPVRLAPATLAQRIESNVVGRLKRVSLSAAEYSAAMRSAMEVGARGVAIDDVLLLSAARKCQGERIHTLNRRHFAAFAPDLRDRLVPG